MLSPRTKPLDTLLALPDHVLTLVFERLDNADLASLRLAGKGLRAPASAAVKELRPHALAGSLAAFPTLERLDLTACHEEWREEQLAGLAQAGLTSLALGKASQLSLAGMEAIGELCRLRSFELTEAPVTDGALQPLSRLTALRTLSLRDCCKLTDEGLKVITHLPALESVELGMCWQLTDATLAGLADSLPHLRRLDLQGCERFTAAGLRQLCKATALETLLMPACWQLGDDALEVVARGMPQLRCLGLFEAGEHVTDAGLVQLTALSNLTALDLGYSCWAHTPVGLRRLVGSSTLRGLQMLNVGGCEGTCDDVLEAVAGLTQLTMLDVSECQRVTQRGIQHLAKLPRLVELSMGWNLRLPPTALAAFAACGASPLTRLDLSFCGQMGDRALELVARLPALQSLSLRKCTRVSDVGLRHLARCGTLRRLDLSYCSLVTTEGLKHLATLPCLDSLLLVDCPRAVTVLGMRALAGAVSLRSLDASDNKRLDDGCMQALSFASQLRSLSIRACPEVTDHGLMALTRIINLRDLNIDLCISTTPAAVARLQLRLPLLSKLRPCAASAAARLYASNARLL